MRDQAPPMYRGIGERALAGTASPRKAIHAMCLQCVGYERKLVTECRITACPLHAYRPYIPGKTDSAAEGATLSASDEGAATLVATPVPNDLAIAG